MNEELKEKIIQAFMDVMDGQDKWYEIQNHTGLSRERCEEIQEIYLMAWEALKC